MNCPAFWCNKLVTHEITSPQTRKILTIHEHSNCPKRTIHKLKKKNSNSQLWNKLHAHIAVRNRVSTILPVVTVDNSMMLWTCCLMWCCIHLLWDKLVHHGLVLCSGCLKRDEGLSDLSWWGHHYCWWNQWPWHWNKRSGLGLWSVVCQTKGSKFFTKCSVFLHIHNLLHVYI